MRTADNILLKHSQIANNTGVFIILSFVARVDYGA
jgi:hypothetical protein